MDRHTDFKIKSEREALNPTGELLESRTRRPANKHANYQKKLQIEASNAIGEMMEREMKNCDVIRPPFEYKPHNMEWPTGTPFVTIYEASKTLNQIGKINAYVFDTMKWTAENAEKMLPEHKIEINKITKSLETPLHAADREYCRRTLEALSVNTEANQKAALQFCFVEYKKRIDRIINLFSSTIVTVCIC